MTTNPNLTTDLPLTRTQAATPVAGRTVLVGWLVGLYLVVTWLTAVAAVALASTGLGTIGQEASVHAVILALVSILTLVFTVNLLRGKPRADLRLRIIAIILAIALIVTAMVLPLPIWMIIGHVVGAGLLIGALILLWPRPTTRVDLEIDAHVGTNGVLAHETAASLH